MKQNGITTGTVLRTVCLLLALGNQLLAACGKSPLPITDEELTQLVSGLLTAAAALAAWWENNSFTKAAVMADGVLKTLQNKNLDAVSVSVAQDEAGGLGR